MTIIIFALQVNGGAGLGSWVTLAAGIMCLLVIILGTIYKSNIEIVWIDTVFLVLAFVALGLWLLAKQPVISAVLATAIEVLGFMPTVRKSWSRPYSETLQSYFLNIFRFSFALFALQTYSIVTIIYPITWAIFNGIFAVMLVIRRRQVKEKVKIKSIRVI